MIGKCGNSYLINKKLYYGDIVNALEWQSVTFWCIYIISWIILYKFSVYVAIKPSRKNIKYIIINFKK